MLNTFGIIIVVLMLIPNAVYGIAMRGKGLENRCTNKAINTCEQIGRYGSMVAMALAEPGFASDELFAVWFICAVALIVLYSVGWGVFFILAKNGRSLFAVSLALAVIPSIIFIGTGLMQRVILQIILGVLFAAAHIYITVYNNRPKSDEPSAEDDSDEDEDKSYTEEIL